MEKRTQLDLVNQHLQSLRIGEVLQDKLKLPNVDKLFVIERSKKNPDTRQDRLRIPFPSAVETTTRDEIVKSITDCLQYDNDIVAIAWTVGDTYLEIHREAGTTVNLAKGVKEDTIHGILMTVLRSRASVQGFEWEFGKPFIKVSHENKQYA